MDSPADFNVLWDSNVDNLRRKVIMAIRLGYRRIAINYQLNELVVKTSKKRKKNQSEGNEFPDVICPQKVIFPEEDVRLMQMEEGVKEPVKLYSRFTAVLTEAAQVNRLQKDPVIRSYDLISCIPVSEKLLQLACNSLDVDIIQLNLGKRLPFRLKPNVIHQAAHRGISFEILYVSLLRDSHERRYTISNATSLLHAGKGKNVLICSGAEQEMEFRSPADVLCLMSLFDYQLSKQTLLRNYLQCLTHAGTAGKRVAKCIIQMHSFPQTEEIEPDAKKACIQADIKLNS